MHLALEEPSSLFPREIIYCQFPLSDGSGNSQAVLKLAVLTVIMLMEAKVPTFVTCNDGVSRSPAIVAVAFAPAKQESPVDWLTKIAEIWPHDVAPALRNDLRNWMNIWERVQT